MPVYPEIWDGPARNYRRDKDGNPILSRKLYQTVHNTTNDATAEGEASYAKRRTDGTSSHYYCDNNSIVQSLNTDWCAGHVGSLQGNTYGISYEITGFNSWSRETWLSDVAWGLLAKQMARDCRHFGIPVRLLTIAEMRAGNVSGFITHDMARQVWGGTDHTDPGPNFPMDHLLSLVRQQVGDTMANIDQRDWDHARWRIYDALVAGNEIATGPEDLRDGKQPIYLPTILNRIAADAAELKARPAVQPAPVDAAALKAVLLDPEVLKAIGVAVLDEDHRRSAE